MPFIVLGGNGRQGRAIVRFLDQLTDEKVVVVDPVSCKPEDQFPAVTYQLTSSFPIWNSSKRNKNGRHVVISCLSPQDSVEVGWRLLRKGYDFIDLGGSDKATQEHIDANQEIETTLIPDCGLAPGLPSSIAGKAAREKKTDVRVFCGGLPVIDGSKEIPYKYALSFNPNGIIGEYMDTALILRGGKCMRVPSLSEKETILAATPWLAQVCPLEATHTSAGLSFAPIVLCGKLNRLEYKTLRYPGHWSFLKEHILWRGREEAIKAIKDIFIPVSAETPDLIVLGCIVDNKQTWWHWEYDSLHNISAMAQATGYTVAAVATMIHDDLLPKGVIGMHDIDLDTIIERARLMPGQFQEG